MRFFKSEGRLARVSDDFEGEFIVVGDLHGDLKAFERVKDQFQSTRDSLLIFLGDYADRGEKGLEVVEGVRELLEKSRCCIIALKGNHENYQGGIPNFIPCDLPREVEEKKGVKWNDFYPEFELKFLDRLHLAALIPNYFLLVHGGISSKIHELGDLANPSRKIEEDIIWSDPIEAKGESPNPRGAGVLFGPNLSESLAEELGVRHILRSHQPGKAITGPYVQHSDRVITLSSTRVYGGRPFALIFGKESIREPNWIEESVMYLD